MVWHWTMKFATHLQCEYAQVPTDLLCENVVLVHCLVAICFHISPFFLYLQQYAVISEFWSTVSCSLTREQGLQSIKPLLNVYTYWTAWNMSALMVAPSHADPLVVKMKYCMDRRIIVCLQLGYVIKLIIVHWSCSIKTCNWMCGRLVYCH